MTENEKGVLGCMGLVGAGVLVWASIYYIGWGMEIMRDPKGYAARQEAAAAEYAAEQKQQADKAAAEEAAKQARYAEAERRDAEQREKENACIREFDYETCRRIYNPTTEELKAQIAISQRANRIAEAYR